MQPAELVAASARLLGKDYEHWRAANVLVSNLAPDGSTRRFFRLRGPENKQLLAVLPPVDDDRGQAEALSFFQIGRHLQKNGVTVPRICAFDEKSGLAFCEDLGNERLHDCTATFWHMDSPALRLYEKAVRGLARMQIRGAENFDPTWCYDSPRYDSRLMQETESWYFLRACCTDLLQLSFNRAVVEKECALLAETAAMAPAHFFLHRDFQSRNIMIRDNQPWFIDFQGGRLGPLGYDLASLLLDPYAALPAWVQEHLLAVYLDSLQAETSYDEEQFRREYSHLALQRNLQILGAFAFLSQVRGKVFFAAFIQPALHSLLGLLQQPEHAKYVCLRSLCDQCLEELPQ